MDLTSIDPNFTCTSEFNKQYFLIDHTNKVNALIKNNKWFVINNYENVFKWLSNSFLTKFSNMDIDHDLDRSLSYDMFPNLANKKYVLNNYEEYRPILIEDIDWENTDANTNSSDYICTLIKKKASLYQDLSELVTSFCDGQGNEIPKFSEIPITYDSETYSDIYTNEFTWDANKLGTHTIMFWATQPSTGNYIISLLYYPETGNPNNQNRVVTTLDFSYGDETMKRTINGTEYTFKKCFTDPFTVSTAGIYRFNIYTSCGIILLEEAYTYIYGKTLDTYNRELMDRNSPSIHTYKFALSPSTYDLVCYNIKKIVKYYFGTSQRFTLINLIYSILYNSSSLTTENVITNNNTLLFALIFDIYFSLSDKAETNDGKIIEDITKPIIIQQNWWSDEFTEVEPTEYWGNNKECLLNETNYVLNEMYHDNKNINFYNYLVNTLNFLEIERYGLYSGIYYSIMCPILIPTPISNGEPLDCISWNILFGHYVIKSFDMFFVLKLSTGLGDGSLPTVANIKTVMEYLWSVGKIGNVWPIKILACYLDTDSNDDYPLLMLLCKGSYEKPIEIEYIEGNGTQWIDLGVKGNDKNDAFEAEFLATSSKNQARVCSPGVNGHGANSGNLRTCNLYVNSDGYLSYSYITSSSTIKWTAIAGNYSPSTMKWKCVIDYYNSVGYLNNKQFTVTKGNNKTTTNNMGIFNTFGSYTSNRFRGKLFSFKMRKSNEVVRDMIPVKIHDSGYLYDKIEKKLYKSGITTPFTPGPKKADNIGYDFSYVEYIESDGINCPYICTNCIPSGNQISIRIKFRIINWVGSSTYTRIMATYINDATQAFRIIKNNTTNTSIIMTCGGLATTSGNMTQTIVLGNDYEMFFDGLTSTWGYRENNGSPYYVGSMPDKEETAVNIASIAIGDVTRISKFRIYGLQVFDGNDSCIGDFVPVQLGSSGYGGDGALYDRVTDKVYINIGSGQFTCGPDAEQPSTQYASYDYWHNLYAQNNL